MLTDTEVRDFFHGDQTSAASSAVDQTEELIIDKVGFPKIFRLPSESYIIGRNELRTKQLIYIGLPVSLVFLFLQTGT